MKLKEKNRIKNNSDNNNDNLVIVFNKMNYSIIRKL